MSGPQIELIFWVFWELSCLLSMTWEVIVKDSLSRLKKINKVPSSIFSPEFQFQLEASSFQPESELEAWAQSL